MADAPNTFKLSKAERNEFIGAAANELQKEFRLNRNSILHELHKDPTNRFSEIPLDVVKMVSGLLPLSVYAEMHLMYRLSEAPPRNSFNLTNCVSGHNQQMKFPNVACREFEDPSVVNTFTVDSTKFVFCYGYHRDYYFAQFRKSLLCKVRDSSGPVKFDPVEENVLFGDKSSNILKKHVWQYAGACGSDRIATLVGTHLNIHTMNRSGGFDRKMTLLLPDRFGDGGYKPTNFAHMGNGLLLLADVYNRNESGEFNHNEPTNSVGVLDLQTGQTYEACFYVDGDIFQVCEMSPNMALVCSDLGQVADRRNCSEYDWLGKVNMSDIRTKHSVCLLDKLVSGRRNVCQISDYALTIDDRIADIRMPKRYLTTDTSGLSHYGLTVNGHASHLFGWK